VTEHALPDGNRILRTHDERGPGFRRWNDAEVNRRSGRSVDLHLLVTRIALGTRVVAHQAIIEPAARNRPGVRLGDPVIAVIRGPQAERTCVAVAAVIGGDNSRATVRKTMARETRPHRRRVRHARLVSRTDVTH